VTKIRAIVYPENGIPGPEPLSLELYVTMKVR
jgi:hypothetical protein